AVRRRTGRVVRSEARVVAGRASVLGRAPDSLGAGRIPRHVVLLPPRLLEGVVAGSDGVHGRRAAEVVLGRALLSAHPSERTPLLSLSRAPLSPFSELRRD